MCVMSAAAKLYIDEPQRSGQVRSECLTCTFRASCCSARLSRASDDVKTLYL